MSKPQSTFKSGLALWQRHDSCILYLVSFEYPLPQSNRIPNEPAGQSAWFGLLWLWVCTTFRFAVRSSLFRSSLYRCWDFCLAGLKLVAGNATRPYTQLAMPLYCDCVVCALSLSPSQSHRSLPLPPPLLSRNSFSFNAFYISARRGRETALHRTRSHSPRTVLVQGCIYLRLCACLPFGCLLPASWAPNVLFVILARRCEVHVAHLLRARSTAPIRKRRKRQPFAKRA